MRSLFVVIPFLCVGCAAGNISSDVSKQLSFGTPIVEVPTVVNGNASYAFSTSIDLSQDISEYKSFGALSLSLNSNDLLLEKGTFAFANAIEITLSNDTNPPLTVISQSLTVDELASDNLMLYPNDKGANLLPYFSSGATTVSVLVDTNPAYVVPDITDTVSFHLAVDINKSL
jgi:hypothetical protein